MQRDALAATGNPCFKQNTSAHVQIDTVRLKKHELQGLDTDESTAPCVIRGDVVSLSEMSISADTDTAVASTQYFCQSMWS